MKRKLKSSIMLAILCLSVLCVMEINDNAVQPKDDEISEEGFLRNSFSQNITGVGSQYPVTFHQSLIDDSERPMNSTNNTLNVNLNIDEVFNSSYTEIRFNSITAYNDTIIEDKGDVLTDSCTVGEQLLVASFKVPNDCYINGISFLGKAEGGQDVDIRIYNSTEGDGGTVKPYGDSSSYIQRYLTPKLDGLATYHITVPQLFLNTSTTHDNTYFIGVTQNGWLAQFNFAGTSSSNTQYNYLHIESPNPQPIDEDWTFTVSIAPFNVSGLPSDYGLRVNGSEVSDVSAQTGMWRGSTVYPISNEHVDFNVTASKWNNLTWNVNYTQINFIKTDVLSTSKFTVANAKDVWWNTSIDANVFHERFENYYINATIPSKWTCQEINVNGTIMDPARYTIHGDGIITIRSGNGTYDIHSNSTNLASGIQLFKDSVERSYLYTNDTDIVIRGLFSEEISGDANITVYDSIETILHSELHAINGLQTDFNAWTLSPAIIDSGTYVFQLSWSNETDAGIILRNVDVVNPTVFQWNGIAELSEIPKNNGEFNISFYWYDEFHNLNVNTTAKYELDGNAPVMFNTTEPDILYKITLNSNDLDLGLHTVKITVEKLGYQNLTYDFQFYIVGTSQMINDTSNTELNVVRGINATFAFQYVNTTSGSEPAAGATINEISVDPTFIWSFENVIDGDYVIQLNTSNVDIGQYNCRFNVSKVGIPTIEFEFVVEVLEVSTSLTVIDYNSSLVRRDNENLTVIVYYNDDVNNLGISTVVASNTSVYYSNGTSFGNVGTDYLFGATNATPGYYTFTILMNFRPSGNYSLFLSVNNIPNYVEASSAVFSFWYTGNTSVISIHNVKYLGNQKIENQNGSFLIFHSNSIKFTLMLNDTNMGNAIIGDPDAVITIMNGSQKLTISDVYDSLIHGFEVTLDLASFSIGNYSLLIGVSSVNYEDSTFEFNITITPKYELRITKVECPENVTAGESFTIKVKLEYRESESEEWKSLASKTLHANTIPVTVDATATTDSEGIAEFQFTFPTGLDVEQGFEITFSFNGEFDLETASFSLEKLTVTKAPEKGIPLEYIYYAAGFFGFILIATVFKRKVVDVSRATKMKMLVNSTNMIEDALNIQHILIIYKNTGVTLFFKTFGQETFDPNLISGFLTAIQSFGSEIQIKDSISEMKYKENVLLFGEGDMIRVALVLNSSPSDQLKTNLNLFVAAFEMQNEVKLKKWKGQLNEFRGSGGLIDEYLNTWVILPHMVSADQSAIKAVKSQIGKTLISVGRRLAEESGRDMFFIASLLQACTEDERCDISKSTHALIEIRKAKAIVPISIEEMVSGEMTEEEIQALVERVTALEGYTDTDKQKLALELKDMNPIEREATLVSLEQGIKLKGTFSGKTITPKKYATVKESKKVISQLLKEAKVAKKQKNYDDAIFLYEQAEIAALQWNLLSDAKKYKQMAFDTFEDKFKDIYETNQKEATKLEKAKENEAALEKYRLAFDAVQELFKMGIMKYEEIGRSLKNKILHLSGEAVNKHEKYFNLTTMSKYYAYLKGLSRKIEKTKDPFLINMQNTELMVVANQLFKMGSVAHADDIRLYKNKIERKLRELSTLPEEKQAEIKEEINELNETKEKLLEITSQFVEQNNLIQALASYRQIFEIFGKMGDYNNAVALDDTMGNILDNSEGIEEYIEEMESSASQSEDHDEVMGHLTIAKSLAHVIYDVKKLQALDKKMKGK